MTELMNWLAVFAYFAVFLMGLVACFKDAKLSWITFALCYFVQLYY